jgi:hypothetical protein
MYLCFTRMLLVCTRMYSCVTRMLLVCTRMLLVCTRMLLVCTRVLLVCTRMYLCVTRMLLVWCFSHDRLAKPFGQIFQYFIGYFCRHYCMKNVCMKKSRAFEPCFIVSLHGVSKILKTQKY